METLQINSGEYIGFSVLKIRTIPHVSILTDDVSATNQDRILSEAARNMSILLTEVYQLYKDSFTRNGETSDMALDLTWVTEAVTNQPFKARIDLFVAVRAINRNSSTAQKLAEDMTALVTSALDAGRYEFERVAVAEYFSRLSNVTRGTAQALVREERVEDLQNQFLPVSYAYDLLPVDYPDLSRIAGILIANPDCAVSFQLIPTHFTSDELAELNRTNQFISMLSHGVNDRQVGNLSISAAEKVAELFKYYSDNKSRALFAYNIVIYGDHLALTSIGPRVMGQISTSKTTTPNLKLVDLPASMVVSDKSALFSQPWVINDAIINCGRNQAIWQSGIIGAAFYRFPYIVTADESANFFRLPIGTDRLNAGFMVNESGKTSKTYSGNLINAGDIVLGRLKSSSAGDSIGLTLKDLAKHMLVVGTPGSGKTTFSVGLLDRLWKEYHIPFLVIEPAKNEYRALIQSIPELQVFTPGKNFISPFVFNPFVPPKNVKLETYKSTLKTAFAAGVSMSTPLDKIFEDTINNCYSDFRWLDTYTSDDKGQVFNIADFIKCFRQTFDEIGYTGDARNIGRAGIVRLKSLTNLFDNYFSIPIEDILSRPTVIELAAIENSDQKALIIALLLLSILAYVNANYVGEGGLRNFILLEEAHVLLDSTNGLNDGSANPGAIAQGLLKRMLAEIRSYGVGIAVADQSPRKVGIDIVALTDIKVAFRLVENQDKQIIADSIGMTDVQTARLSKLKPGEAFLFFNRLDEPEEIVTPDYRLDNNISISLSDEGIRSLSTYWTTRSDKLRPYPECQLCPYCSSSCDYNRRILAKEVARRIFKNNIGTGCRDVHRLKFVLRNISNLIRNELNDEPFSRELLSCVKVYLWRHINYDTDLRIPVDVIINSLARR